jgi:ribose 5-phosphate isomerase A
MSKESSATDLEKAAAARRAAEMVRDGQLVGLGTGSTATIAIRELGRRVKEGLKIEGVATSTAIEALAASLSIPLVNFNEISKLDITIDGADEIDSKFNMIKGGGGALIREKLVAIASEKEIIIVDSSKRVARLGDARVLPVEVLRFGWSLAERALTKLGCTCVLRRAGDQVFLSDNGNYILDCNFGGIDDPAGLEKTIKLIPAVVESGLFINLASTLIVGSGQSVQVIDRPA